MTEQIRFDVEIDRTDWARGPWDDEPDRLEWRHNGVACLMVRNMMGVWCGYAAVEPGHPWHGVDYGSDCTLTPSCGDDYCGHSPDNLVEVHGGLTYSDRCQGHICHVPQPGEPDDVWWFGFDCGHAWDVSPGMEARLRKYGGPPLADERSTYKDVAYVRAEVERLAEQLLKVKT